MAGCFFAQATISSRLIKLAILVPHRHKNSPVVGELFGMVIILSVEAGHIRLITGIQRLLVRYVYSDAGYFDWCCVKTPFRRSAMHDTNCTESGASRSIGFYGGVYDVRMKWDLDTVAELSTFFQ
jgi:hypothetical protein